MDFVNIFACSHPSQLRVFVRFENSSLPRIWKLSNLVLYSTFPLALRLTKLWLQEVKDHELTNCYHYL